MAATLLFGSTGLEVKLIQAKLSSVLSDIKIPLDIDGIFGVKTQAAVQTFQRRKNLRPDGIFGPLSWQALNDCSRNRKKGFDFCACHRASNSAGELTTLVRSSKFMAAEIGGRPEQRAAIGKGANVFRPISDKDRRKVEEFYGDSIDFSTVFLRDLAFGTGAYVLALTNPLTGKTIQIINIAPGYSDFRIVHECGHVWQSQHHSNPQQYIANSLASRALAKLLNDNNKRADFDAYAYVPGRPFSTYGAEQMAQAVANGEADLIKHVKSIAKGAIDPELKLVKPRCDDMAVDGVKHGGLS